MKPDFLHIGTQKTGSVWVAKALRRHPRIWVPPIKNILYFNPYFAVARLRKLRNHWRKFLTMPEERVWMARYFFSPLAFHEGWYQALFPQEEDLICGEVAESYCMLEDKQIARIQRLNPECKIILVMRNPVDQMLSNARQAVWHKRGSDDSLWTLEDYREYFAKPYAQRMARYTDIIHRWEQFFPASQMLVLFYDELKADPLSFLEKFCTFLGADFKADYFEAMLDKKANISHKADIPVEIEREAREMLREEIELLAARYGSYAGDWQSKNREALAA